MIIHCFDTSWLVPTNWEEITWLTDQFPHSFTIVHISHSTNRLLLWLTAFALYWMRLSLYHLKYLRLTKVHVFLSQINFQATYTFWSWSVFLILVLLKFLEPNRWFRMWMNLCVCDTFIGYSESWTRLYHISSKFLLISMFNLSRCWKNSQ